MARGFIEEKIHQLRYFYRGTGVKGVIREIARKLISPIYKREVHYLMVLNIESQEATDFVNQEEDSPGTECMTLESAESLRTVQSEIPSSFRYSVEDLKECLEQGCVVFLARRPRKSGSGKEVVGYSISQQGVFLALRHERRISPDIFFGRYIEILPEYRGQRIRQMITRVVIEYHRSKGVKKYYGTIEIYNRPSILASLRGGETRVGTFERVSVLGGLFKWQTPWERVEEALRQ